MGRGQKIADAFVEIRGDKGKFSGTIGKAKLETAGFAKSATKSLNKVKLGLGIIAVAATAAGVAIGVKLTKAIIRAGVESTKTAIKYDKLNRGLTAVVGSSSEAAKQIERLSKIAELPGLSFEQAIQGSINLQAAGIEAALAERALSAFGNALVTVGKGSEDLAGVNLALTQIANKTSGFGQDIRQLQERLPQMQTALKNAFDGKPIEDLSITGKELVAALVTEFEKLEKASGGPANAIENLSIAFDRLKAEVGKTMLSITQDTADSLTSIIDRIRIIIPVWRLYQDEVVVVFQEVATIALKTTGVMVKGMINIIAGAAPLMFQPITDRLKTFQQLVQSVFTGEFPGRAERMRESTENLERNINRLVDTAISELPKMSTVFKDSLGRIDSLLKGISVPIENARAAFAFLRVEFDKFGIMLGLIKVPKEMGLLEKLFKTLPGVIKINIEQLQRLDKALVKPFNNALDAMQVARNELSGFFDDLAQEAIDKMLVLAPAFENLFIDFFEGNTKSLWKNFFNDLKRIAIRELAAIFAFKLVTGLVTGGASFGAAGLLAGLGPIAAPGGQPARAAQAIGGGLQRIGGFLEGGALNVNITGQDLINQDTQTITKQVQQGILPAMRVAAADGI